MDAYPVTDGMDYARVLRYLDSVGETNEECFKLTSENDLIWISEWYSVAPKPKLDDLRKTYRPDHKKNMENMCDEILRLTDTYFTTDAPLLDGVSNLMAYRRVIRGIPQQVSGDMSLEECHKLFPTPPDIVYKKVGRAYPFMIKNVNKRPRN